jgi:hypothetical protein
VKFFIGLGYDINCSLPATIPLLHHVIIDTVTTGAPSANLEFLLENGAHVKGVGAWRMPALFTFLLALQNARTESGVRVMIDEDATNVYVRFLPGIGWPQCMGDGCKMFRDESHSAASTPDGDYTDEERWVIASFRNRLESLTLLLRAGADPNEQYKGCSVLHDVAGDEAMWWIWEAALQAAGYMLELETCVPPRPEAVKATEPRQGMATIDKEFVFEIVYEADKDPGDSTGDTDDNDDEVRILPGRY